MNMINHVVDVLFGHNTWRTYGEMAPRIFKFYDFVGLAAYV